MTIDFSVKATGLALAQLLLGASLSIAQQNLVKPVHIIRPLALQEVKIEDRFWSPKLKIWDKTTVYDVLDKFDGKYEPDREDMIRDKEKMGRTKNAFLNFDLVAQGKKNIGGSDGPPWYDGLVYETIRGAADLLVEYPDAALEKKIDAYIQRIAAAQNADKDGYINTFTTLVRPHQRWGENGGDDRFQHDVYNGGMLVEAGIHYYQATGKTQLLTVAVKMANYMVQSMGPAPKLNIIPAHAGPEESFLELNLLFKNNPALKSKIGAPVHESDYYELVKYWIEKRGVFADADGGRKRASYGSYDQDSIPVFEQKTIEGHAVRATLLATAVAAMGSYSKDARYINTANHYWNNMIGKRMFITGGQGAIANDEKFGPDYFLPESAYLETCASVGAAFFSQRMNELEADGKYMDEFERVVYNNMLSSVAADGQHYLYENPLIATEHKRWNWHGCPCCPPMFLKMVGALPQYIYAKDDQSLYVNLFIGSAAQVKLKNANVLVQQQTAYPWKGSTQININPKQPASFTVYVRIPGWAVSKENPFDLYSSATTKQISLKVNGKPVTVSPVNGYVSLNRTWKKGDKIELDLPIEPRLVTPNEAVATIAGKTAIAAGPLVYAIEGIDNPGMPDYMIKNASTLIVKYRPDIANGVNIISGTAVSNNKEMPFTAVPFYAIGNRGVYPYKVWVKK